ncbi:hypothetical protein AXG93_1765s1040 [Marchantia polymorpha subsp. ruderalis]|uniref:Uncharacterized protein n=1 Tax=Marchantia polymorpha subsp. ruderalis TaxID=1480154 RepID=A0A176VI35_MARPO|nr:hypothetical protein AXG93_1765s1040 [Marchantia polymorpha subsp. ruderalis]
MPPAYSGDPLSHTWPSQYPRRDPQSLSMRPAPPSDTGVRTEVLTSSVVDEEVPSSAVMRMATSVLRSPLFSATELIDSDIDLARIQTFLGGASDRSYFMTRENIAVQLRHNHPHDSSQFGVRAVVTSAESYDVLVGGAMLYPMDFWMGYWTETDAYRPGWQSGDGHLSELPVRFIARDRPLGSSSAVLASVAGYSGVLTWPDD